ncbi:MAG: DUF4139 domain-containing protein [Opitutales bacterium]
MRSHLSLLILCCGSLCASSPSLTIYNDNFAVVRQTFDVDLSDGLNTVTNQEITRFLEPDSVVFRDPAGAAKFRILEQNYEGGTLNQDLLLKKFEGKEITFLTGTNDSGYAVYETGKIIRGGNQPIVQTERGIMTGLPGRAIFPSLGEGSLLRPRLAWDILSEGNQAFEGELSYISTGFRWKADYNVVARGGDIYDVVGWVTLTNNSGTRFEQANIKLMAGEVNRVQPEPSVYRVRAEMSFAAGASRNEGVSQKAFADFHLYTLPYQTDLENQQTKQVEFMNATGVRGDTRYIVDVARNFRGMYGRGVYQDPGFLGRGEGPKVEKRVFIENSENNALGMPIPAGRMRFYQSDEDSLEFIGEDRVEHTPKDETLDLLLGNAFDLVAERKQVDFQVVSGRKWMQETIEYRLANRKEEPVSIEIREPLVRSMNAKIIQFTADASERPQADTLVLKKSLKAGEETKIRYTVEYTW